MYDSPDLDSAFFDTMEAVADQKEKETPCRWN